MLHRPFNAALAPTLAALLMTAGLATAAEDAPPNPAPNPPGPLLEDLTWQLVAYRAGDRLAEIAAAPRPPRLRFEAGRVSGSPGCNRIGGA